jgi:thiamine kinase-like enzyme
MQSKINEIIKQIPGWENEGNIQIDPLEGLTNKNYSVTVNGKRFVLRVSGQNTKRLGINRKQEFEVLKVVSEAGIGAAIEHYILPEGHLLTHYIDGRHLTLEEYRTQENIRRIVKTVKRLHNLPLVHAKFSPFNRVIVYAEQVQSMGVSLPHDYDKMWKKTEKIQKEQINDTYQWEKFCHNDLFCVNVLDDGNIRFIDWEFSGVSDIYYDLATLTYAYDSPETLSRNHQEYILECYFGHVSEHNWIRLEGMKFMVMFFTAMWGLLQQGMQNKGYVEEVEGFNFLEYANVTFEAIRKTL